MQACALTCPANLFLLVFQSISQTNSSQEEMFSILFTPLANRGRVYHVHPQKPHDCTVKMCQVANSSHQQCTWPGQARMSRSVLRTPRLCCHVSTAATMYEKVPVLITTLSKAQIVVEFCQRSC